jgi:hypothetical protein
MADRLSVRVAHLFITVSLCPSHRCGVSVDVSRGEVAILLVTPSRSIYILLFIPPLNFRHGALQLRLIFSFSLVRACVSDVSQACVVEELMIGVFNV